MAPSRESPDACFKIPSENPGFICGQILKLPIILYFELGIRSNYVITARKLLMIPILSLHSHTIQQLTSINGLRNCLSLQGRMKNNLGAPASSMNNVFECAACFTVDTPAIFIEECCCLHELRAPHGGCCCAVV